MAFSKYNYLRITIKARLLSWNICYIHLFTGIGITTTMDAEDCAVLNMLAKNEAPQAKNTGSATTVPASEDYQLHGTSLYHFVSWQYTIYFIVSSTSPPVSPVVHQHLKRKENATPGHIVDLVVTEMKELALDELALRDSQNKQSRSADNHSSDDKTNYYQSKYPNIPAHRYE